MSQGKLNGMFPQGQTNTGMSPAATSPLENIAKPTASKPDMSMLNTMPTPVTSAIFGKTPGSPGMPSMPVAPDTQSTIGQQPGNIASVAPVQPNTMLADGQDGLGGQAQLNPMITAHHGGYITSQSEPWESDSEDTGSFQFDQGY
jgi:hypothetical protein